MSEREEKQPEVVHGPEPRPSWGKADGFKLGALPHDVDVGELAVGEERSVLIAAPFVQGKSSSGTMTARVGLHEALSTKPSPMRDKLGLDPSVVLARSAAESFAIDGSEDFEVSTFKQPPPLRVLFRPTRAGKLVATIHLSVVGDDRVVDTKIIRVTGIGYTHEVRNSPTKPDRTNGATREEIEPVIDTSSLENAAEQARDRAATLADAQARGVNNAGENIESYNRAPVEQSEVPFIIEIALSMGIASIAGIMGKYLARRVGFASRNTGLTGASPRPVPRSDELTQVMVADAVKDGIKNVAKKGVPGATSTTTPTKVDPREISSNARIQFLGEARRQLDSVSSSYRSMVLTLKELLAKSDPEDAIAAMQMVAGAFAAATETAAASHQQITELEWVSRVAKIGLPATTQHFADGTQMSVTKMDSALGFGERGPLAVYKQAVPKHDGVLDIHVRVPADATPVETAEIQVVGAEVTGISQELADRLLAANLETAGIPLRLVVQGQPAIITRDEAGNVRVNGFLRTKRGKQWTEQHMHAGARKLVERVVARTLESWGVVEVKSDDGTGRDPQQ